MVGDLSYKEISTLRLRDMGTMGSFLGAIYPDPCKNVCICVYIYIYVYLEAHGT